MTSLNLAIIEFDIKRKESGNDYAVASDLDNKTGRDGPKAKNPETVQTIFVPFRRVPVGQVTKKAK